MKTLLITEKLGVAKALIASTDLTPKDCDILNVNPHGIWRASIKKLDFNQIPYTDDAPEIIDFNRPRDFHLPTSLFLQRYGRSEWISDIDNLDRAVSMLQKKLQEGDYDQVVCFGDIDPVGQLNMHRAISLLKVPAFVPIRFVRAISISPDIVREAYENRSCPCPDDFAYTTGQSLKYSFDHWWNSNSAIVLSEAATWAGLVADPLITKFELLMMQHLHAVFGTLSFSPNNIFKIMSQWVGTGKFNCDDYEYWYGLLATSSRGMLVEKMISRGFLIKEENEEAELRISKAGSDFINLLHPRSFDKDLPFRIEEWRIGRGGGKESAKRYIRTFFGRQLRYQRMKKNESESLGVKSA